VNTTDQVTNILIVDDHRLFAEGLSRLLETIGQSINLHQCYSGQQAIQLFDRGKTDFDLLLIDFFMPGIDGIELLQAISSRRLAIPVAAISSTEDVRIINRLMANGAIGFIPKSMSSDAMLTAVNTLLRGEFYLPDELWNQLDFVDAREYSTFNCDDQGQPILNDRQIEVLQLMANGSTNKQISTILSISEATVKYHINILFRVLGVKNRTSCIHEAHERQIIA